MWSPPRSTCWLPQGQREFRGLAQNNVDNPPRRPLQVVAEPKNGPTRGGAARASPPAALAGHVSGSGNGLVRVLPPIVAVPSFGLRCGEYSRTHRRVADNHVARSCRKRGPVVRSSRALRNVRSSRSHRRPRRAILVRRVMKASHHSNQPAARILGSAMVQGHIGIDGAILCCNSLI